MIYPKWLDYPACVIVGWPGDRLTSEPDESSSALILQNDDIPVVGHKPPPRSSGAFFGLVSVHYNIIALQILFTKREEQSTNKSDICQKMKSGTSPLYPNQKVAERVSNYAEQHSTALPKYITDYHDWVESNHERSNYMISNFQGQCHVFLARTVGAKRVLEIGVYLGYSALVWAHAVGEGGQVTGLEFSDEYASKAREVFKEDGVGNVEVVQGDALEQ